MKIKVLFLVAMVLLLDCCKKHNSDTLSIGLIAYYPFNGNAKDASGYNHDGTINGAVPAADIAGNQNQAFYFNGTDSYISLASPVDFTGLNEYTFSLWAKPTEIPQGPGGIIFNVGSDFSDYTQGLTYQSQTSMFAGSYNLGTNPGQSYSKTCCFDPNQWIYVAMTRDTSSVSLYINGTLVATQSTSAVNGQAANYGTGTTAAIIGARSNLKYGYFFAGIIDEVRIYNRALSAVEISQLKFLK